MIVVLNVRVTGSAEIVVTAGSSTTDKIDISDFLGRTIGDVLRVLKRRGYILTFVTDKFFVCEKYLSLPIRVTPSRSRVTMFSAKHRCSRV